MTTEVKKAIRLGYHNGVRVHPGEEFSAPVAFKGSWFVTSGSAEDKALSGAADQREGDGFLQQSAAKIVAALKDLSVDEIKAYISEEQAGRSRKGVLAAMEDEAANRVGVLVAKDDPLA